MMSNPPSDLIYLDNAATTYPKPPEVVAAIRDLTRGEGVARNQVLHFGISKIDAGHPGSAVLVRIDLSECRDRNQGQA